MGVWSKLREGAFSVVEDDVSVRRRRRVSGEQSSSLHPSARKQIATLVGALEYLPREVTANPKPGAVHRLRTTVRRLEALVSRSGKAQRRAERSLLKQLARIRRRAGKVRDLDIQIRTLASVKLESAAREKARVLRVFKKSHAKRRRQLVLALADETAAGLERRLQRMAGRLATDDRERATTAGEERDEREALNAALDQFSGLVHAYGRLTEDNLHDFRTDAKRLRYLAETAGKSLEARSAVDQLKRIQDAIGDWHDWLTLTRTAAKVLKAPVKSPLLTIVRTRTRARFLRALRITAEAKQDLAELCQPVDARKPPRRVVSRRSQVGSTGSPTVAALRPAIGNLSSPLAMFHVDGDVWRR